MKSIKANKFSIVDLFAGAGGLSYGFVQTGRYEVRAAFENNCDAQKTYKRNHCNAIIYNDVADALTEEVKEKIGHVDVIIGGPPCQGFSNANRQKNHAISRNNSLVKMYVQAVLHLNPTAFVMENVSMLKSNIHQFYVNESDRDIISRFGIKTFNAIIPLLNAEYLFDGADKIVTNARTIQDNLWDENDYLILNVIFKNRSNKEKLSVTLQKHQKKLLEIGRKLSAKTGDGEIPRQERIVGGAIRKYYNDKPNMNSAVALCMSIENSLMIQRMLSKAKEIFDNRILVTRYSTEHGLVAEVKSMSVLNYIKSILGGCGYKITHGILSAASFGAPQKRMRFVILGIKQEKVTEISLPTGTFKEGSFRTVKDAISDLEEVETTIDVTSGNFGIIIPQTPNIISDLCRELRDSNILYNHITTATTPEALKRFKAIKQGSNFHSLDPRMKTTYSDPTRTQNTIYLRLDYSEPSGTVVNVRKSMWIHPTKDRALSVREAARLQTFPDSFVFCGTKDSQYQQVGNAVPPILAKALAEKLYGYLDNENKYREKIFEVSAVPIGSISL